MRSRSAACAVFAVVLMSGCASESQQVVDSDRPTLSTVRELGRSADVVVVGSVTRIIGEERDAGGNPEVDEDGKPRGTQLMFFEFLISKSLRSGLQAGDRISVGWLSEAEPDSGQLGTPYVGREMLLFLRLNSDEQTPGVALVGDHYVPVSGVVGVFDVAAGAATARADEVTGLTRAGEARGRPLAASIQEIAAAAR